MRFVNRISGKIAQVTDDFLAKVQRLESTLVFKSPAFKGGKKFLSIFCVKDPEDPEDQGYYFSERLGRDSVAFLLYDRNELEKPYVALEQYHSPRRMFQKGAFTGSLDKGLSPDATAIEEIAEEAGYRISSERLHSVGKQFVGCNTNESVYLFIGDVTGIARNKKNPDNVWEENTHLLQMSKDEIFKFCEWRAILCMMLWESEQWK